MPTDDITSRSIPPTSNITDVVNEKPKSRPPWGLVWRSSVWFISLAVGIGITTDLLVYSMIVPVIPFRLQALGYSGVSGLVGWLLFAYSASIVISTPPIAYLSERYRNRKVPLLCGLVALIGSQVMLMEAPTFWVMALARVAQGISASVIWVVGLALVCDTVPQARLGEQLGFVMMGMSLGNLIGPPVAGALDSRFGFRSPFIFGIIVTAVELICRLLIIERKDAAEWDASLRSLVSNSKNASRERVYGTLEAVASEKRDEPTGEVTTQPRDETECLAGTPQRVRSNVPSTNEAQPPVQLSILGLLLKLVKSSRAMTPVFLTFTFGVLVTTIEPVLPLYLQEAYHFDVAKIGLVYIAAVVPSFISSPLSGWYADKRGTLASTLICLVCALPFWCLIAIKGHLAYFLVMFAFLNFFSSAIVTPVTAELAAVSQSLEGVGYGHMYGAFNVAYGVGSAVGPVIGGQIYDRMSAGWFVISFFNAGMVALGIVVAVAFFGNPTLLRKIMWRLRARRRVNENTVNV